MHFELFSIFTTRFSGPQVGGGAVRDWIWPVIGATQDQSVMERLGFEQARLLCTHSPNLNRWGIVSRQNKLDIELDFPVPAPQSQEQLIQYLLAKRTRRSPSTTHRAAPW